MRIVSLLLIAGLAMGLASCQVSKPYVTEVDRVDQNVDGGNRGYLTGTPPPVQDRGDLKRPFLNVDIDLPVISGTKTRETKVVRHDTTAGEEQVK